MATRIRIIGLRLPRNTHASHFIRVLVSLFFLVSHIFFSGQELNRYSAAIWNIVLISCLNHLTIHDCFIHCPGEIIQVDNKGYCVLYIQSNTTIFTY